MRSPPPGWTLPQSEIADRVTQVETADRWESRAYEGVPADRVEGYQWLNVAAALDSDPQTRNATQRARDELAETMSADPLAEGQRRSAEWTAAFNARPGF